MNTTTNQSVLLQETKDIQQQTLDALRRTRRQATESKEVGTKTIEQLEDYDARLSKTKHKTTQLVETLKKTEKQQNKFALWSGQFTTRRKAKKELQQELATEADTAPKTLFTDNKTNGNDDDDDDGTNPFSTGVSATALNNVVDKSLQTSKDVNTVVNRKELFEKAKAAKTTTIKKMKKMKKKKERKRTKGATSSSSKGNKTSYPAPTDVVALTEQDQNELNDIDRIDQLVDEEIDALGDQVTELLALSTAIGNKAKTQTTKLNEIHSNVEETNTRTRNVNKRIQLFTMTRRERNKKEKQFKQNMKELLPTGTGGGTAATKMAISGVGR